MRPSGSVLIHHVQLPSTCSAGFSGRRTLMKTPVTKPEILGAAVAALSAGNVPVTVINDSPGFVVQRLLAMIVNVGTRIAELRIAAPADIDIAVELGLNYPKGPLALGDALGPARVLAVLDGMHAITLDPNTAPQPGSAAAPA